MVSITPSDGICLFNRTKIIVIKVGSSLLVDDDKNAINTAWLEGIANDIAILKRQEKMLWWSQAGRLHWDANY